MAILSLINQNLAVLVVFILAIEILLLFFIAFCFFKILSINKKSTIFFGGKEAKSFEKLIMENSKELKLLDNEVQELYDISNKIHNLAAKSIHKVGILRFNPFNDIGGDQSFSLALLDGKDSGVVVSSLHTKEGTRVYSKPVVKGEAEKYPLTEEEKQVIKIAVQKKPTKV